MALALITRDKGQLDKHLRRAHAIMKKIYPSELGTIIHIILPAARMHYDLLDNEKAAELLNKVAKICLSHEVLPYVRQRWEIEEILRGLPD